PAHLTPALGGRTAFLRPVIQVGICLVTIIIVAKGILLPLRAHVACHAAELVLPLDPRLAQWEFARAVALDPACDVYWGRLATAAQASAKADAANKIALLGQSRQAFERAIDLVPVHAYYHLGLGRVLMELARQR